MWETMPEFDASLEVQPTFPLLTCFWQCRHLTSRKSPPTISKWDHHKLWGRPFPGILEMPVFSRIFKLSNPQKNLGRVRTPLLGNASIFRPSVTATLPLGTIIWSKKGPTNSGRVNPLPSPQKVSLWANVIPHSSHGYNHLSTVVTFKFKLFQNCLFYF